MSSCKKVDLPPEQSGEVVFFVKANSNIINLNIEAGRRDFILYSEFEKDNDEVHTFIAGFEKDDCIQNCGEKMVIKIRDFQQATAAGVNMEKALAPGLYQYSADSITTFLDSLVTTGYLAEFDAGSSVGINIANLLYAWDFGDNTTMTTAQSVITHEYNNLNVTGYPVRLELMSDPVNFCQSSQIQNLTFISPNPPCSVFIDFDPNPNGLPDSLIAVPGGGIPPYTYLWSTGSTSPIITSVSQPFSTYSVSLTDGNNCESMASISLGQVGTLNLCSANFTSTLSIIQDSIQVPMNQPNPFEFSKITIEYTSPDSVFFTTETAAPVSIANSYFEIVSFEDFEDNPNGQKTKKVSIRFACQLIGENGTVLQLTDGKGVIGVAYP